MPIPELTEARYIGSICVKHPEMLGIRRKTNGTCIACHKESVRKALKKSGKLTQIRADARKRSRESPEFLAAKAERIAFLIQLKNNDARVKAEKIADGLYKRLQARCVKLCPAAGCDQSCKIT
jgi:SUMO ligase MMS21 Smc5/6 complex component